RLTPYPGYGFAADCGPVAPTGASGAASGKCARPDKSTLFPPGGAALTGLRVHRRLRIGSPDRRVRRRLREMCQP
ncbi:hypothetical protein, partial [Klebsiella grimontii]|uniref:hypothetical protein n=1 Tax=Klebsiella grimontii TaxID=2058152 RepID=UPI001C49929C